MILTNKKTEKYLEDTRITLQILKDDAYVKGVILSYGYTDERLQEGIALHGQVDAIYQELITRRGEQAKSSLSLRKKFNEVSRKYSCLASIFRTAFYETPGLVKELGLEGERKRRISSFIAQAVNFYTNTMEKQHILNSIAHFALTTEKLQEEFDQIKVLRDLHKQHINLMGENQRLVLDRDKKTAKLRRYMKQLKTVLFMLLEEENPRILERLGIFVRNRPRPGTGKDKNNTATQTDTDNNKEPAAVPNWETIPIQAPIVITTAIPHKRAPLSVSPILPPPRFLANVEEAFTRENKINSGSLRSQREKFWKFWKFWCQANYQNPPPTFASGGQKPFREKVSGLPKAFYYDSFYFSFFLCVSLCTFVSKNRRWILD